MSYTLDSQIPSQTFFLNSENAVTRNPFVFNFPAQVRCPNNLRMILSLHEVTLPYAFNNVTEANNQLTFQILTSSGSSVLIYTLTFPPGIYSAISFRDFINSQTTAPENAIKCVYDEKQFKFSFVSTFRFQIINTATRHTTCGGLIGVNKLSNNVYDFPVVYNLVPAFTVFMPSSVNFAGTPYVYVKMENLPLSNFNSFGQINDALARIPVNTPYGYKIFYRPNEVNKFLIGKQIFSNFTIKLEDINNNILLMNGNEFQMILKIDYIYPLEEKVHQLTGTLSYDFSRLRLPDKDEEDDEEV
jgi:hypothetical protein